MTDQKQDFAEKAQVHWAHEDARPTSLHGNGHASFEHTTVDWAKVTCRLCQSLRPAETRTRRRIRRAVESRGYNVISMEWEPWYDAGEKSGIGGGWTVLTDAPWFPNTNYGDEVWGLSVDEVLADIDWMLRPTEPCECVPEGEHVPHRLGSRYQGMPETPIHAPECRWHIAYRLSWWPSANSTPPEQETL